MCLQFYQGRGSEASCPDQPAEGDRDRFHRRPTEKERLCGHHTAVSGMRAEEEMRYGENSLKKRALTDLLCASVPLQDEDGRGLTDEEIQAEANTFMFAGETL